MEPTPGSTDKAARFDFTPLPGPRQVRLPQPTDNLRPLGWGVAGLGVLYCLACLYGLRQSVLDLDLISRATSHPGTVTLAELSARDDADQTARLLALAGIMALTVAFTGWRKWLHARLSTLPHYPEFARSRAYQALTIVTVGSFVMVAGLWAIGTPHTIDDLRDHLYFDIVFRSLRAILGAIFVWLALSLTANAARLLKVGTEPMAATD